jgi:glycerol dehydrogenase
MISTTIFPGRYIQGKGAIQRLGSEAKRLGNRAFLIADPYVFDQLLPDFQPDLTQALPVSLERFEGECSDEEVERLAAMARSADSDVIIGVGGGKTLDTAKAVAFVIHTPVIIVPTIASTDAPCSALSVIYTPQGAFKRYLLLPHNPNVVLVDSQMIANAPVRFLIAGIGDALSTWFEADACQRNYAANMTGDVGSNAAYHLARFCYDVILAYGVPAKISCEAKVVTPALERVIEANTLLSGLGFESGGLASCHAIHNGLTLLHQTHDYWHGEKVAIGVVTSLFLTDRPAALIDEVYTFCEAVGLPTTLTEIGLANVTDAELMRVAEGACAQGETIYHEPMPMSADKVFAALKAADAEGRRRKERASVPSLI